MESDTGQVYNRTNDEHRTTKQSVTSLKFQKKKISNILRIQIRISNSFNKPYNNVYFRDDLSEQYNLIYMSASRIQHYNSERLFPYSYDNLGHPKAK